MILHIEGDINAYYVQTLCMLFFPGAKFGAEERPTPDTPTVTVKACYGEDGEARAEAEISLDDRTCHAEGTAAPCEDVDKGRLMKVAVGRAVFGAGTAFFGGYTPPWGILTGVRPSKVASELLKNGNGVQKARRVLRDQYFVNPKKAALAVSVASMEQKLTKKLSPDLCSVYISIPFCPSRCAYCSFVSYTSGRLLSLIDDYLLKLYADIRNIFSVIRELGLRTATIYIGGGTPTVLTPDQLRKLLSVIAENCDIPSLAEFTVEAGRPDTITKEKLNILYRAGVTRISVNPQSLDDEVLRAIGRRHTADDFFRAYDLARASGIKTLNVDLIAGLPEDNFGKFSQTVDRVINLGPENITVHTFCVKKAADILKNNSNVYSLTGGDTNKCVEYSQMKTKFAGYKPYYMYRQKNTVGNLENVGYALEGTECMYNIFMMEELQTVFSVGAGAVTKLVSGRCGVSGEEERIQRIFTPKYPYEYLRDADAIRLGDPAEGKVPIRDKIMEFYKRS